MIFQHLGFVVIELTNGALTPVDVIVLKRVNLLLAGLNAHPHPIRFIFFVGNIERYTAAISKQLQQCALCCLLVHHEHHICLAILDCLENCILIRKESLVKCWTKQSHLCRI